MDKKKICNNIENKNNEKYSQLLKHEKYEYVRVKNVKLLSSLHFQYTVSEFLR